MALHDKCGHGKRIDQSCGACDKMDEVQQHQDAKIAALQAEINRLNSGIDTILKRWRIFAKEPRVKAYVRQLVSDMADDLEIATKDGK